MAGEPSAGEGASNVASFDKAKFGKYLRDHISKEQFGEGACALHVRLALFDADRKLVTWPASAKNWGASLLALGFSEVATAGYVAQSGDIAVIQPPKSAKRQDGHIQGYDGTAWISDFVQTGFWPGPAYRTDKPTYVVYRYGSAGEGTPAGP